MSVRSDPSPRCRKLGEQAVPASPARQEAHGLGSRLPAGAPRTDASSGNPRAWRRTAGHMTEPGGGEGLVDTGSATVHLQFRALGPAGWASRKSLLLSPKRQDKRRTAPLTLGPPLQFSVNMNYGNSALGPPCTRH